jgi:hypothetical protein
VITPGQLFAWNPEIIIAERRSFYDALRRNRMWRGLAAVRNKRVYLAPSSPFGWIDDPPGVNRLIGLYWLAGLFYPDTAQQDMHAATCEFYDRFYGIKLTNAQIDAMLRSAGISPAAPPAGAAEALPGLGVAPAAPLPGTATTPTTPAAPITPPSPSPVTPPTSSTSPMTPLAPLPSTPTPPAIALPSAQLPPAPSTASATCTLPGANSPLALETPTGRAATRELPAAGLAPLPPPGRRGQAPALIVPRPETQ